jgi:hypothetical protein
MTDERERMEFVNGFAVAHVVGEGWVVLGDRGRAAGPFETRREAVDAASGLTAGDHRRG